MDDARLTRLEEKVDKLLELQKQNANNIIAVYRRTTALAYMLEAGLNPGQMRMPSVIRAEIDATLDAEAFEALAKQDPAEFMARYGEAVLEIVRSHGVRAISTMGELTQVDTRKVN
tara:strand:+ start:1012 stop:1359 length:348 start_codon:yes stop_codon:yes gene_type:complete